MLPLDDGNFRRWALTAVIDKNERIDLKDAQAIGKCWDAMISQKCWDHFKALVVSSIEYCQLYQLRRTMVSLEVYMHHVMHQVKDQNWMCTWLAQYGYEVACDTD